MCGRAAPEIVDAIWHCDPNHVTCRFGHLLKFHDADFAIDQRRIDGHVFGACQKCSPTTFFFAVVTARPSPMATCYAIDKRQFDEWIRAAADQCPTPEVLHRLTGPDGRSYNPNWRPSR